MNPECAMSFKDLIEEARPREKLMGLGAGALADAELVALLLRTGIPGKNVLQLSQELPVSYTHLTLPTILLV